MTDDDDTTFEAWMDEVNIAVHDRIGLRVMDLPDADFRAWFADGMTPAGAADELLARGVL